MTTTYVHGMSTVSLRPYQATLVQQIRQHWSDGARNVLAVLTTGGGKCLGRGTPVLRYDGRVVNVEDIRPGDQLMGPDSRPRAVLSTCSGVEPLYRVTPVKGDAYVVNESHILSLKTTGAKSAPAYPCQVKGRIVNISVVEFLSASRNFRHTHKGWRTGVDFSGGKRLLIDPYFLGVWLGDGNSRLPEICSGDSEIVSYLKDYAEQLEIRVDVRPNSENSKLYRFRSNSTDSPFSNRLKFWLRVYNLIRNKHIPLDYKTASKDNRLALLAGVIDTDGHHAGKGFEITLKSKILIDDVTYVARSLGFSANPRQVQKKCGNTGTVGSYWICHINGAVDQIPCRLPRKKAPPRRQKKDPLVTGISIEPIGPGEYFGFEIDGDHLFLLGDFTVTHNTVTFGTILAEHEGASCAIAHRRELVGQMSVTLARLGARHRIIAPDGTIREIVSRHLADVGRSYYDANSRCAVAGVDTLARRDLGAWANQVTLWVTDEAAHLLRANKWGKGIGAFPNARGLGVTATPCRADGKGLGRHADGVMDAMVVGPSMRWLINGGFLTDYRIFAPPSDFDRSAVAVSETTGDFNPQALVAATKKSHILGDVVESYLRIAPGKLGVTFAVNVELAGETAARFRAAGVPAEVVSADTPELIRAAILRRFARREILQLVNVDLFSEGFDLPALEVVSMARATESYGWYAQAFGRALRPLDGKQGAIIIDHVGNVLRHGLPDAPRKWSLDRRERKSRGKPDDVIPVRVCPACTGVYERIYRECPYCGHVPEPASRSLPECVDGDLHELDPTVLARLRGEAAQLDADPRFPRDAAWPVRAAIAKRHGERRDAQQHLRSMIAWWAGWQNALGRSDSEGYRRFFHSFGVDVATAQTLGRPEAEALSGRIEDQLARNGVQIQGDDQ